MGSFSGKQLHSCHSCLHSHWGSTLKRANSFFCERIIFLKGLRYAKKADGSWELFPFVKVIENHEGVLTHLKSWSVET